MKTATFQFQARQQDYMNLVKYLPVWRLMNRLLLIITLIGASIHLGITIYWNADVNLSGSLSLIVSTVTVLGVFVLWSVSLFIWKRIIERKINQKAVQIFNRYSHNGVSDELVEYHQDQNLFLIGKAKKEVPVDQYFDIYETKDHYLFYRNKEKIAERFLIPKDVNPDQLKVLISRLKRQGVKVTDRSR